VEPFQPQQLDHGSGLTDGNIDQKIQTCFDSRWCCRSFTSLLECWSKSYCLGTVPCLKATEQQIANSEVMRRLFSMCKSANLEKPFLESPVPATLPAQETAIIKSRDISQNSTESSKVSSV